MHIAMKNEENIAHLYFQAAKGAEGERVVELKSWSIKNGPQHIFSYNISGISCTHC